MNNVYLKKIIILFSSFGIAAFFIFLISGYLVWKNTAESCPKSDSVYNFRFFQNQPDKLKEILESYIVCADSHAGIRDVLLHLTLSTSFIGMIFFLIVLTCIFNLRI